MKPKALTRLKISVHTPAIVGDRQIDAWENVFLERGIDKYCQENLIQFAVNGTLISARNGTDNLLFNGTGTFT